MEVRGDTYLRCQKIRIRKVNARRKKKQAGISERACLVL
jgi:hypothetical protein